MPCDTPFGYMLNQHELTFATRSEVEALYKHIILWQEYADIGHFAAMENPKVFVQSLHDFKRAYTRYDLNK